MVCKSIYTKDIATIDYLRIHINNLYSYLFDKDVYYVKEYYTELYKYKDLYYKTAEKVQSNTSIDIKLVKNDIENITNNIDKYKKISLNKKADMSWYAYRQFINKCIRKIFDNCDLEYMEKDFKKRVNIPNWNEDNLFIGYINRSLSCYVRTKYKEIKGLNKKIKRVRKDGQDKYVYFEDISLIYNPLQLIIGNKCTNIEELEQVKQEDIHKLTKRQKKIVNIVEDKINDCEEYDLILFNEHELPYINIGVIAEWVGTTEHDITRIINSIYGKLNKKDNFCMECGKKIIKRSNRTKYCDSCKRKKELDKKKKWWRNNKARPLENQNNT